MGQKIWTVTKTIVTDTNAYSSGDFVGDAILTLEDVVAVGGTKLMTIVLTELDANALAIDFLFWSTTLPASTKTNNAALDVDDVDLLTFLGGVSLVAGDYFALNDNRVACKRDINLLLNPANTTKNIFCTPVTRGTPTYTASGLTVKFVFEREMG